MEDVFMKNMNGMKKLFALLLALTMMVSLFVGCGEKEAETTEEKKTESTTKEETKTEEKEEVAVDLEADPAVITMLYSDNANYPYQDDWMVIEELNKISNVDLQLEAVPESDYVARRTVVFNSGEMPDIISKTHAHEVSSYIGAGLFLPISEYVDQMPNFKAYIDKYDYHADLDNIREADGNYYILPVNCNTQRINNHGWMIRQDQLEEYGIDQPTTMEEIFEASLVWKENNPDAYPMTNRFGSANIISKVAPAFNTIGGWGMGNMFKYVAEDDNFIFAPTSEGYKEMLMWFNKMYENGLLDPEFSTLDSTVYEQRIQAGEQFILVDWIGNERRYNMAGPEESGNPNFNVQPMMPPKGPWGDFSGSSVAKYEQGWAVSAEIAEREDFAQVLAFIDNMYSEEVSAITTFGVEGESYEVLEDGRLEFMDFTRDYTAEYGINQNSLTVRRHDDWFASNRSPEVVQLFADMNEAGVFTAKQPTIVLDDMQKEEEGFYRPTLGDYVNQMTEKFIFGVESFDNWDAFVAECEAKGMNELDTLYNTIWDGQK
jgi:putative aldouronate transport system substrate-binding protein